MSNKPKRSLAVLTSGGDAPGMNAAVRAVVRTALDRGVDVYAVYEGYQGLVDSEARLRKMDWDSVGGILQRGGTVIGSARCNAFRTRQGRLQAALHLVRNGIDSLVVIGGDGSLTGADMFRGEWDTLLEELVQTKQLKRAEAKRHPQLTVVGLVGSIDNDMFGTDMTIGADTALHRIISAIDAIASTAASHQRTFVVEVMGRNCGYLALMSALATGADWAFIPESPPNLERWEEKICQVLKDARKAGRRHSVVLVAEGARDRNGKPVNSEYIRSILEKDLQQDARVTILGHVQRGGAPSAFDRYTSTLLGHAAVETILDPAAQGHAFLIGMKENRIVQAPLEACVAQTTRVAEALRTHAYPEAMALRGNSFVESFHIFRTLVRARPRLPKAGKKRFRFAVLTPGAPSPGMNTAVRAAVRLGMDRGHVMLTVKNGFAGLIEGQLDEVSWMEVTGWASRGGSELGTSRKVPQGGEFYAIAKQLEAHHIDGLLVIGGWSGYEAAYRLYSERERFPAFDVPVVCLPASINNNLPGSELSIGADTALNNIVEAVDKIKQSAVATNRAFIIEVMGRFCGYLALMSGLATGAERVYLHEEGVTLKDLQVDVENLITGFKGGKRLGLMIRNEEANRIYNMAFMCALFEAEGGELFEVRQAILGHLQQGGNPTPFDRIQATRLAASCVEYLDKQAQAAQCEGALVGVQNGKTLFHNIESFPHLVERAFQRPKTQWWMDLRPIARVLAQPGPSS